MRIIAGKLGGRIFDSPNGHKTHPMSDKARGGLFNTLGDISGMTVLDCFAGSGALAYEAVSRGAATAVAVDSDKRAVEAIRKNVKQLSLESNVKAVQANVSGWSDNNPNKKFDMVIADPPYDDLQEATVDKLTRHVNRGGLFILSWPGNKEIPKYERLELVKINLYGDAQLVFYRRIS